MFVFNPSVMLLLKYRFVLSVLSSVKSGSPDFDDFPSSEEEVQAKIKEMKPTSTDSRMSEVS